MKLILIHGREQQDLDAAELRKTWLKALEIGMSKSNVSFPENIEILFPYFGNFLDDLYQQVEEAMVRTGVVAKGHEAAMSQTQYELLKELAQNARIPAVALADQTAIIREKGFLNLSPVQWLLQVLDDYTSIGKLTLETFTGDVSFYLDNAYPRNELNQFIAGVFEDDDDYVVVGHSLGSVIGYNVLHGLNKKRIRKYITVGSPLGLRTIRDKLAPPIRMPGCIRDGWYNAYDDRDVVALNPLDKLHFDIEPPIFNRNDVRNDTPNRHNIEGYLSDEGVARAIYDALTGN